jgi:phage gp36-like protein
MAYSTKANVQTAVGGSANLVELADLENEMPGSSAGMDSTIDDAIRGADGFINSYLRQRFAVPLAVVPDEIRDLSASWASRILRRNRYKGQPIQADLDAEVIDRKWLDGVAKGQIQIGVDPSPNPSDIIVDTVQPRDTSLTISREKMKGFI